MSVDSLIDVAFLIVALVIAFSAHEFAHAWAAVRLGDLTPRMEGRLTLNPRPHIDPFGSLLLPGITLLPVLFGSFLFPNFAYGKSLSVNPWNLRRRERDLVVVALAGPAANLILAFAFGAVVRVAGSTARPGRFLLLCLLVNVFFCVLNLVPLWPFDGARILLAFLSPRAREVFGGWEPLGALFVIVVFFIFAGPIFAFVDVVGGGICDLAAGSCQLPAR